MAAFSFWPIVKSLSVDTSEQHVYAAGYNSVLDVARLGSSTGSIVDAQRHFFLDGYSEDIKIHAMSDGSGYYVTGKDSSFRANI